MKIPRDVSQNQIIKALHVAFGYVVVRQKGSHIRLATNEDGQHRVTIPIHDFLKIGTLSSIINQIASNHNISREEVIENLFQ